MKVFGKVFWCIVFLAFQSGNGAIGQQTELLKNGQLSWSGGELPGWKIEKGAGGDGRASVVRAADDGSLELSGEGSTRLWNMVGQNVSVKPGDFLEFSYTAKASGLRRRRGQFDNCYAAIWFTRGNKNISQAVFPVTLSQYSPQLHIVRVPENATHGRVTIFLSKTGTLNIKDVGLRKLQAAESFDVLVRHMDRYYSYFDHKKIDWKALTDKYQPRFAAASGTAAFEELTLELLAELKDGHTWIMKEGRRVSKFVPDPWQPNFDFKIVDQDLKDVKRFGKLGLIGKTEDDFGYIRVTSLVGQPEDMQRLIEGLNGLGKTNGMIVDLRFNRGGSETLGVLLAGVFCEKKVAYARNCWRLNEQHDEFYENSRGPVIPRSKDFYDKPVVCLIGPGSVSSGEGTAMMFNALPNVTTLGQPTRGSTGNPAPVLLPNGVEVWFSRWVAVDVDGEPIEDRGVQPDLLVEHGDGDPTWQKARALLQERSR